MKIVIRLLIEINFINSDNIGGLIVKNYSQIGDGNASID
jgi:hypothetical protein